MNFRVYVETPYRDWTIQQTWNEKTTQYDRVGVKGPLRVHQDRLTYPQFIEAMDKADGRTTVKEFLRFRNQALADAEALAPVPPSAPAPAPRLAPSHPSLFEERP